MSNYPKNRKSHKLSEETKRKIGIANSKWQHIRSKESIEKQIKSITGRKRKPFTEEHKKNIKISRSKQKMTPCSIDTKFKISKSNKGKIYSPKTIFKKGQDIKRKFKDTSIEIKIGKELKKRNINFLKHEYILGINVDFYLPKYNIIIECDGDYWHNLPGIPEKDAIKTNILLSNGYRVFRFWEHEIDRSSSDCIDSCKL